MKRGREAIRRLLLKMPSASDKRIAALLGAEPGEVNRIRRDMLAAEELPKRDVDPEREDDI